MISFLANIYIKWLVSVFQGLYIKYAGGAHQSDFAQTLLFKRKSYSGYSLVKKTQKKQKQKLTTMIITI